MKSLKCNVKSWLILSFIVFLGLSNFFGFCYPNQDKIFPLGSFPTTPVNFEQLNSEWDEYNQGPPPHINNQFNLYYSSNKKTSGNNFDILATLIQYTWDQNEGKFWINPYEISQYNSFLNQLSLINTQANEYGPNFSFSEPNINFLFYSSDVSGKQHIYCVFHEYDSLTGNYKDEEPFAINILNSQADDGYLTIDPINRTLYFMSNRDGSYDIFKRAYPTDMSFKNWLVSTSSSSVEKVPELNSSNDDKCPYINGKLMVFCSDRAGGLGGFDLWYSLSENGKWSAPVNFGSPINSEFDEYRPVVLVDSLYTNDLMMYSSNRPGGKGGFDLYYVGIPKMTK